MAVIHIAVHDRRRLVREGLCLLLNDEPDIVAFDFVDTRAASADVMLVGNGDTPAVRQPHAARVVPFDDATTYDQIVAALSVDGRQSLNGASPSDERGSLPPSQRLTPRETEILTYIAAGQSASEVSTRLGISRKTVENHKRRIFTKLAVQNQAHAVAIATRAGLIDCGG